MAGKQKWQTNRSRPGVNEVKGLRELREADNLHCSSDELIWEKGSQLPMTHISPEQPKLQ